MIAKKLGLLSAGVLLALSGCVSTPDGPSVMVLPGNGKNFDQFRYDDMQCRDFAHYQVGGKDADTAAANSGVKSAAVGTAVGAAAGAAIGDSGRAAGVGAGAGLLIGAMAGADAAQGSSYSLQRRYDYAYEQCMYSKGNKIPVSGRFANTSTAAPAPRASAYPPPPPPPPPPRY
jgi:hypothetical protein